MSGEHDEVLERLRAGDAGPIARLFLERQRALVGVARRAGAQADADDIVSEAFARMLRAARNGRGPSRSPLGYLTTAIRALVASRPPVDPQADVDGFDAEADAGLDLAERSLLRTALMELPERTREVLLLAEVHGYETADLAGTMGISKPAAASSLYRAREALRVAYLAQHCSPPGEDVHPSATELARHVRGGHESRTSRRVAHHVAGCDECGTRCRTLEAVNATLRPRTAPVPVDAPSDYEPARARAAAVASVASTSMRSVTAARA